MHRWVGTLVAALALAACPRGAGAPAPSRAKPPLLTFTGMCDASGAVPLGGSLFAVADDEDNLLRIYDAQRAGAPLRSVDSSPALGLAPRGAGKAHGRPRSAPEIDIEAAARLGERAFWIGSHGRSSAGKLKPARLRLFATGVEAHGDAALRVVGSAYEGLLDALFSDARYAPFALADAAQRAPKAEGGLNIEGMAPRAAGGVWIAFRSPTPGGKALLAALENPEQVVQGGEARLAAPRRLDLAGLGVRDLCWWRDRYWIVAGASGERGGPSLLYQWDGRGVPERVPGIDLSGLNPEAVLAPPAQDRLLLLSDDGNVEIDGVACKQLQEPRKKRFRGLWVTPAQLGS